MGLLDDFSNFLQTPGGQGLASGIASYMANARRGTPVNNIGKGMLGGVMGYGNAKEQMAMDAQREQTNLYNQMQQKLLQQKYDTDFMKATTDRDKALADRTAKVNSGKAEAKMIGRLFSLPVQYNEQNDDVDLMPAVYSSDGYTIIDASDKKTQPTDPQIKPNLELGKMYGFSESDMNYIMNVWAVDPKEALREMREIRKSGRKGAVEARDYLAKERATAEALNMPLGQYLIEKGSKSGQSINITNVMPGEAAEAAGKKEGYDIGEQAAMIENKYSAIDSLREAKSMMAQGIYTGYWGDVQKTLAKASLGAVGDRQKAARTEQFLSYIGNVVVPRLKEFGGNDSNEEMRYLKSIMGGDTSMEPEAISAILDSAERKISRGIERLQRQRGALERGQMPDLGPGPSRQQKPAKQPAPASNSGWSIQRVK
jgi:hypothetical protein